MVPNLKSILISDYELFDELVFSSQEGPKQWILQDVQSLFSQVQLFKDHFAFEVHMVHHTGFFVPSGVRERLRQASGDS